MSAVEIAHEACSRGDGPRTADEPLKAPVIEHDPVDADGIGGAYSVADDSTRTVIATEERDRRRLVR